MIPVFVSCVPLPQPLVATSDEESGNMMAQSKFTRMNPIVTLKTAFNCALYEVH